MALRFPCALAALLVLVLSGARSPAYGQSGTQTTPDGIRTLISKDVGGERWAMTFNRLDGSVTGNVFLTDGSEPKFVWCTRISDDGRLDPENVQIGFRCFGSDRCVSSPCVAESWEIIGDVTLPGAFFLPARDPFSPLQRADAFCDPLAYRFEPIGGEPSLGIDSTGCNYLTVVQPSLTALQPGSQVFIRIWHFALTAPDPGVAYLAIQVGDRILWRAELPIPSNSEVLRPLVPVDFAAPSGTPVYFHLQNHGTNSYNVIDVRVGGETGTPLVSPNAWSVASDGVPTAPRE